MTQFLPLFSPCSHAKKHYTLHSLCRHLLCNEVLTLRVPIDLAEITVLRGGVLCLMLTLDADVCIGHDPLPLSAVGIGEVRALGM